MVGPFIAINTLNSSCIIKEYLLYEEIEVGIIFDKKERRIFDILFGTKVVVGTPNKGVFLLPCLYV